ncbi:hypothetical protein, partial [Rhizobium sp. YS-1r]|uniref:hypothetical protein n=1 Tax=Rhizobium sp. YS-1r TaxID=1532558 RepID=UPI001AEC41E9
MSFVRRYHCAGAIQGFHKTVMFRIGGVRGLSTDAVFAATVPFTDAPAKKSGKVWSSGTGNGRAGSGAAIPIPLREWRR